MFQVSLFLIMYKFLKYIQLLRKIHWFHLISWCENFAESHSFHRILGESPETLLQKFIEIFRTKKLGAITVF